MISEKNSQLRSAIETATTSYYRLVLVVGESGSGKSGVLREISENLGTIVVNVNLALSGKLLELTARQRSLRLPGILCQMVEQEGNLVVLDNLEILFDQALLQDPLRLLQSISRNRTIVASWNGTVNGGRLEYAEAGHPEYRTYDPVGALLVNVGHTVALDSPGNKSREAGQA